MNIPPIPPGQPLDEYAFDVFWGQRVNSEKPILSEEGQQAWKRMVEAVRIVDPTRKKLEIHLEEVVGVLEKVLAGKSVRCVDETIVMARGALAEARTGDPYRGMLCGVPVTASDEAWSALTKEEKQ